MSDIVNLEKSLQSLENDIKEYNNKINKLSLKIDEIIKSLGNNSMDLDSVTFDNILNSYQNTLDLNISRDINGLLDYSVDMEDLKEYKTVTTRDGETYQIYKSDKTNALYIISSIRDNNKGVNTKKDLYVSLKDVLEKDQMVIITYDGNPYKGNVYDSHKSTKDFGFVAKNGDGKMLAFYNTSKRVGEIPRKEVILSYKGLAIPYGGSISAETGAYFDMSVLYQNEYAKNSLNNELIINKQVGLVACQLHVQRKPTEKDQTKSRYVQDTTARFVIHDKVLESFCDRIDNENSYLTAINRNYYGKETNYHTIFEGCGDNFNDRYPQGYLGTHSNVFGVTLETNHENKSWNNFCFTLEAISPKGVICQKEMWETTTSYMVDDWNDLKIK